MKKKVSVIVPYYKNLKYIFQCLQSIYNQNYKNFEIILVYDDNNKNDLRVIKKKFGKHKNFRIFANYKNVGVSMSRNKGIKKAKGYYIAFLDSDDFWKKNKLKLQIKFMEMNGLDLSYTAYEILKNKRKVKHSIKKKYTYNELIKKCDIGLSTVVMRSKMSGIGLFPNLKTQEDFALWLKYTRKKSKIMGINKYLTVWRDKPNSLSKNTIQKINDSFKVFYRLENKNLLVSFYYLFILSFNKLKKFFKISLHI